MRQVYYELARWRLDQQLAQVRELNSRLAGIFTAATALLVLFAAFQGFERDSVTTTAIGLWAAGGFVYVLLVVTTFVGYLDRRMNLQPELPALLALSQDLDDTEQREWAGIQIMAAFRRNEPMLQFKRQMTTVATALWAVDVLLFAASVFVVFV